MRSKKLSVILLTATLAITLVTPPVSQVIVHADDQVTTSSNSTSTTQTHTLNKSYVVYGAGATDKNELSNILGVNGEFTTLTATASDYQKYINPNDSTTNAAMVSSVSIVPTDPGSGVKVNVKKFNGQSNITKVTAQQYAMVAQMAGVTDVTITVSANRPVSGESALTGVYKALNADGIDLNSQNTQSANQMLSATNDAIDANKDDSSYPGKLMAAVGDTTKEINKQKRSGEQPTQVQIENTLNQNLKRQNIYNETKNHTTTIVNALVQFNNAPISSSKDYSSHVSDTINNVKNSTGDMMNKAKQFLNSEDGKAAQQQAQSWWNRFVNWIQRFFN
ncbi:DUF1002 domain-containing protein [Limosilactobacillus fastidiosus]|uniref:DUF1002 domain-containing protein n=1 Tax=Limosilactobacillus fastidiosus TaxID=2759855 RepID=A0ABR6E5R1_9LACO|nr:DUF1002 domain-containing protein [Limosilactobacillus fastidiosus]MBB1062531.1 DUF1002 domain-containing protein [Limosilactobacillus fastidiosus]MCD7083605.1 DUF1002 domain-containing protein [Limosilactobacillus fastidiosus]